MPNFAVYDGTTVVNVIVAESQAVAEQATGLSAVETESAPWIGWTLHDGEWRPPTPFPSWVWIDSEWIAPVPYPSDGQHYRWDEDTLGWVSVA